MTLLVVMPTRDPAPVVAACARVGPELELRTWPEVDVMVCLLPLTPATEGILDRSLFARVKTGAYLVTARRGGSSVGSGARQACSGTG